MRTIHIKDQFSFNHQKKMFRTVQRLNVQFLVIIFTYSRFHVFFEGNRENTLDLSLWTGCNWYAPTNITRYSCYYNVYVWRVPPCMEFEFRASFWNLKIKFLVKLSTTLFSHFVYTLYSLSPLFPQNIATTKFKK